MENLNSNILLLIIAYASKEITQEEFEQLQNWLLASPENRQLFIDYLKIYKKSRLIGFYQILNKDRAWQKVLALLGDSGSDLIIQEKSRVFSIPRNWYKYAAAIIVSTSLGIYFYTAAQDEFTAPVNSAAAAAPIIQPGTDKATLVLGNRKTIVLGHGKSYNGNGIQTSDKEVTYNGPTNGKIEYNYLTIPRGGQFVLRLEDDTKVWLNSQSQLKFPNKFVNGIPRTVELVYGEAYFEVSPSSKHKGAHFNVKVKGQNVEVLGTQFNIKAYDNDSDICTTLVEGKVELSYSAEKVALAPNQQTIVDRLTNSMQTRTVDVFKYISWKEGIFSFQNMPLKDIMKVLSRWYDVDVIFKNKDLENKGFNGSLGKEQDIVNILQTIKDFGVIKNYEIKGKQIILK